MVIFLGDGKHCIVLPTLFKVVLFPPSLSINANSVPCFCWSHPADIPPSPIGGVGPCEAQIKVQCFASVFDIPSGKHTKNYGNHHSLWVNQLFLWPWLQ